MVVDAFLKLLWTPVMALIDLLSFRVTIPSGVLAGLSTLLANVWWVFPVTSILPIFALKIGIRMAQFSFAVVVRAKSFIPTMGN